MNTSVFDTRTATLVLIGTAVCFGLVPLFARELQTSGTDSAHIALYRFGVSALIMLPFLPRSREKMREALMLAGAGMLMGLGWIGYLEAVKTAPVAAAGMVYMTYPLFTLLFAWWLVGQRPTWRAAQAVLLVLGAAALMLGPGELNSAQILALGLSLPAPIAFGLIVVIISACLKRLTTLERMACGMLGAVAGLAPVVLTTSAEPFWPAIFGNAWMVFGVAFVTALVPQLLYTYAAPRVGPARSAATGSFELPTMLIVGWMAFGESVGWQELTAAAMVIAAVLISPTVAPHPQALPLGSRSPAT